MRGAVAQTQHSPFVQWFERAPMRADDLCREVTTCTRHRPKARSGARSNRFVMV